MIVQPIIMQQHFVRRMMMMMMMMMKGFTTHLSPARHLVDVTPTAARHPGSGGSLVNTSVKANSGDPPI